MGVLIDISSLFIDRLDKYGCSYRYLFFVHSLDKYCNVFSHLGARIAISDGMVTVVAKSQSILEKTQEKVCSICHLINLST